MKHFKHLFIICWAVVALGCTQSKAPTGEATLIGKFSGKFPVGQIFTVTLAVPNLALGELKQFDEYETTLDLDGNFSLTIPLFCSVGAMISIDDEECGAVFLSPKKKSKVDLFLNETGKMQVKIPENQGLTLDVLEKTNELFMDFFYNKVLDMENSFSGLRFDVPPTEYRDYILNWTEKEIANIIDNNKDLSKEEKQLLSREMKWYSYMNILFDYEGQMNYLYEQQFIPQKPNREYYSFLRSFDLNNPPFGNPVSYVQMYKNILADSILNIPSITNQPLSDWLKEVKTTMTDLVGFDTGLFYDFLALHAYLQQFNDLKPLSDSQKEDIKAYFKNPTFTKFLFKENDEMVKQSQLSSVVRETPKVEKEKLMETIVSQYKDKVVVVDFWATWCSPCMQAMKEIKPLKDELRGKDVVFIYITNTSSPVEQWEKKITVIDGEHYYLTKEEWQYISSSPEYDFSGIPTYLIFDKNGKLQQQYVGFPGITKIQEAIEEVL